VRKSKVVAATGKTRRNKNVRARSKPPRAYLPAAERRKLIIAAAQEVFARTNLQGARTRDIAKAAEVNQATIFEHFESKKALFHEAVVQPLIDAMRGVHERVELYETAATPAELARLAQVSTTRHLMDMMKIFPLLTVALFSEPEQGRKLYREEIAPLIRQRGEVLRPLVKDGIDPRFVGLVNFGMLFAVAMDRHLGDGRGDLSALAVQFNRLSTSGFAREKRKVTTRERDDGNST
jgi:AcrR family transcriptional regulator